MRVVPQLIKTGKYIRPALGIELDEQLNRRLQALTGTRGVFVLRVAPGSAAQKAGLSGITFGPEGIVPGDRITGMDGVPVDDVAKLLARLDDRKVRSEEHTSELQSRENLVCRLLLEKKKQK